MERVLWCQRKGRSQNLDVRICEASHSLSCVKYSRSCQLDSCKAAKTISRGFVPMLNLSTWHDVAGQRSSNIAAAQYMATTTCSLFVVYKSCSPLVRKALSLMLNQRSSGSGHSSCRSIDIETVSPQQIQIPKVQCGMIWRKLTKMSIVEKQGLLCAFGLLKHNFKVQAQPKNCWSWMKTLGVF